ncbi:MAG TPA: MarR family transcriptional regulator [Solirubrobacteraceae bacterium]|nr:MarR family transcriptional regulator [Solirubrobacteraceae bacterium]
MQATASPTDAQPLAGGTAPDDAALAADLYALIAHVHKNCNAELLDAVGGLELSLTQIKLLHHLEDASVALTLKQGAEAVRVSLPAASRLVDDLVTRGLIERHEDAEDRRMKRIRLTARGRLVIARLNAARLTGLEQFVTTLNRRERQQLTALLSTLLDREEIAILRPQVEAA